MFALNGTKKIENFQIEKNLHIYDQLAYNAFEQVMV
jgi:hypothetical protein